MKITKIKLKIEFDVVKSTIVSNTTILVKPKINANSDPPSLSLNYSIFHLVDNSI